MSALRVAVPGEPVRLIDQGPATGRIVHTRGSIYGGVMVVAGGPTKPWPLTPTTSKDRERMRRNRARPMCGQLMPRLGAPCARRLGHRDDHKSDAAMNATADKKWPK